MKLKALILFFLYSILISKIGFSSICKNYFVSINNKSSLEELFQKSEKSLNTGLRLHRDRISSFEDIFEGMEIWIFRNLLRELYPSFSKKLNMSNKIQKLKIIRFSDRHFWKNEKTVIVENSILGKITIPLSYLKNCYKRHDFIARSPFKLNEWVQVGSKENPLVYQTGIKFENNYRIGKIARIEGDGFYSVNFYQDEGNYRISPLGLYGLNTGNSEGFIKGVNPFYELQYDFDVGDIALIRLTNDSIVEVMIEEKIFDNKYKVLLENGKNFDVDGIAITKIVGDRKPITWLERIVIEWQEENINDTELKYFFNGARKMVSHPDFIESSDWNKLNFIVRYVNSFLKNDNWFAREYFGHPIHEMLCIGAAVCNHKAYLVANILAEAGFHSLVGVAYNEKNIGHAWAISTMPSGETYYVDPGKEEEIIPMWKVIRMANHLPDSLAAMYYRNPNRIIYTMTLNGISPLE